LILSNLLWTQGVEIVIIFALLFLISALFFRKTFIFLLFAFAFQIWFFRNPDRTPLSTIQAIDIISPADGKVVSVEPNSISIFLSPVDVHVNWAPISGTVKNITYTKGKFLPAYKPESGRENENNALEILHESGQSIVVRQIAGTLARRIVCWVNQGDLISRGEKFGMIKLGSRVDIMFPEDTKILVKQGDRVYGGETIIGSLSWESQKTL
jgi:phosphatidylserine decarboxylase